MNDYKNGIKELSKHFKEEDLEDLTYYNDYTVFTILDYAIQNNCSINVSLDMCDRYKLI